MVDTLSDVLRAVQLSGAVFFKIDASTPWVASTPVGRTIAPYVAPGAQNVIDFHVVARGECWVSLAGEPPIKLLAGDAIAFPHGDAHVLSSTPGMSSRPNMAAYRDAREQALPVTVSLAGGGDRAEVVCGFLGCDARPFNPLLAALPRMIRVAGDPSVRPLIEVALAESTEPKSGGAVALARLSELLFVAIVRRYVADLPPDQLGWLAALRDDVIGRALNALHARPARAWTIASLAREVAVSRSVLAERFTQLVGHAPMHYLALWRIQLAASLLRTTTAGLSEIADRVGYGSEAALSRAFKRTTGLAPARYRRSA